MWASAEARDQAVLAVITGAARAGDVLPSRIEIGEMLECDHGTVTRACKQLQQRGLLQLIGPRNNAIAILPTGERTADRRRASQNIVTPEKCETPPAVHRDPCFYCGTRRDIGCGCPPSPIGTIYGEFYGSRHDSANLVQADAVTSNGGRVFLGRGH